MREENNNDRYRPFPAELLPDPVKQFVSEAAVSVGCDPGYLALPLISCLGSAIGTSWTIRPKSDWFVPSCFWTASVGESGTGKSPGFRLVTDFIHSLESVASREYQRALTEYEVAMDGWKKAGADKKPPKPEPPTQRRYYVDDTTTEALMPILAENPRGVMVINGELKSWFASFDRYVTSKGSDAAKWLAIWDGTALSVDRKTGTNRNVRVDAPLVNVTGTIQPAVLAKSVKNVHEENGLLARILIAYPPSKPTQWNNDCLDEAVKDQLSKLFFNLYSMPGNDDGTSSVIALSPEALKIWERFYNMNQQLVSTTDGVEKYAFAKHDQYLLRLALLIHIVKAIGAGEKVPDEATGETLEDAEAMIHWFRYETSRAYQLMHGPNDADLQALVTKIAKSGGSMTIRDIMQSNSRKYGKKEKVVDALNELKAAGIGDWIGSNTYSFDRYGVADRVADSDYQAVQPF